MQVYNAFEMFEDFLVSNFCCIVPFELKSICFCSNLRKVNRVSEIGYIQGIYSLIFCTIFQDYERWGHECAITGTFLVFGMEMLVDVNHTLEIFQYNTEQFESFYSFSLSEASSIETDTDLPNTQAHAEAHKGLIDGCDLHPA